MTLTSGVCIDDRRGARGAAVELELALGKGKGKMQEKGALRSVTRPSLIISMQPLRSLPVRVSARDRDAPRLARLGPPLLVLPALQPALCRTTQQAHCQSALVLRELCYLFMPRTKAGSPGSTNATTQALLSTVP